MQDEIRRAHGGSIYWLRKVGREQWTVTADGVALVAPKDREAAIRDLDAVAPEVAK
jgi:hypothetical protein